MPLPLAPLIVGGAALVGQGINSLTQSGMNRRQMKFSREMYERQYADNIAFWNMQNAYNSPQAQMDRFQAAGLNPHLIYGQGNSGNAGAVATPDVVRPELRSPEWGNAVSAGGLAYINAIYDLDIKAAQADNMKAQNTVLLQEGLLKAAQIAATEAGTDTTRFKLGFEEELRSVSAEARKEQLRQLKVSTDLSVNKDAREAALNASNIKEAVERMVSMRQQRAHTRADIQRINESIRQMQKDGILKDLDIELRKQGINPQDPLWARVVGRLLAKYFGDEPVKDYETYFPPGHPLAPKH